MVMAGAVILSPHQDDAVLSVWHVLSGPGEVSVVNVFTGEPPAGTLGWWDELTGASDSRRRMRERRDEDRIALALAGRTPTDLQFLDLQYRADEELPIEPLADAIAELAAPDALLMSPAGLGGHLDHRAVRSAALRLTERGRRVALYADVPHATLEGWPAWVTNGASTNGPFTPPEHWRADLDGTGIDLARLRPQVHSLDEAAAERKLAAIACYGTQIDRLEHDYSLRTRPDVFRHEVVWPLPPNRVTTSSA
jgi:LmbE family N-acetylglucosaminyl deacetylase